MLPKKDKTKKLGLRQSQKVKCLRRDNIRDIARQSGSEDDWTNYRAARNLCTKMLQKCKKEHFNSLFEKMKNENDVKGIYRLTNELFDTKNGTNPQQLLVNGRLIRKPIDMANAQIAYFKDKILKLTEKITLSARNPHIYLDAALQNWSDKDERSVFVFKQITLSQTALLIKTMSDSAAFGHDMLDSRAIKEGGGQSANPCQTLSQHVPVITENSNEMETSLSHAQIKK